VTSLVAVGLLVAPAHAQLARTFVSAVSGNDANDCNRLTPCRTLQRAHDNTFDQGEITVLDTGGYGAIVITKSISIINDGVGEAGVLVSGGATGIEVNAPPAAYVSLRGLTVQGIGFGGGTGLRFDNAFALTITNCAFRNHTGNGIELKPNGSSRFSIANTLAGDNGRDGVLVQPFGTGTVTVNLSRVEMYNNSIDGLEVNGTFSTGRISAA